MIFSGQLHSKQLTLVVKSSNSHCSMRHTRFFTVELQHWRFHRSTLKRSSTKCLQQQIAQEVMLWSTKSLKGKSKFTAVTCWISDLSSFWFRITGLEWTQKTLFGTLQATIRCVLCLCAKMNWTSLFLACLCFKGITWRIVWLTQRLLLLHRFTLWKASCRMVLFLQKSSLQTLKASR